MNCGSIVSRNDRNPTKESASATGYTGSRSTTRPSRPSSLHEDMDKDANALGWFKEARNRGRPACSAGTLQSRRDLPPLDACRGTELYRRAGERRAAAADKLKKRRGKKDLGTKMGDFFGRMQKEGTGSTTGESATF